MIEVSYYELVIFAIFLLATEPPPNLFQFNGKGGSCISSWYALL